jgi:hypothetical protein
MKNKFLPILAIIFIWLIFSFPYFFLGKSPFPADYQNNFFAPWNVYPGHQGPVKNNAQPDIITQIYPWRFFDVEQYKKGQIPFWNPYSFSGTPHLANYQSAALFPINILFLLPIKFIDIWSLLVLLQPLLAGLFIYVFARKLKLSSYAGLLSSFSFMFCGFLVTWMGYATLGYSILFLPLSLFFILKYVDNKSTRWLVGLSFTFLFSFFAGHFQTSIYFTLGVFGFILYHLVFSKDRKLYVNALFFSVFGLLLAMPQVLPSIEFYTYTLRSNLFQKVEAIPWNYLPTLLAPDFYGNPVTRNDWFGHYAEWSGFSGIVTFVFAMAAIFFKRTKDSLFFIILLFTSLLLAYDTPLLTLLVQMKLPVLSTSAASRIIVLFSFSSAILAGFGFDEIISIYKKNKKKMVVWIAVCILPVVLISTIAYLPVLGPDRAHIAQKNIILPVIFFLLTLVGISILMLFKNKSARYIFIGIVLLTSACDMYRFASKWQSFSPKKEAYVSVPISKFYDYQNDYDRAIGLSGEEDSIYFNIPTLGGYDPLYINDYGKFIQYVGTGEYKTPERSVVTFPINGKYTPQAIDFLGVKYIIHKKSDGALAWAFPFNKYPIDKFVKVYEDNFYDVFQNKTPFDRAFVVSKVFQSNTFNLFDYDLKKVAFVDDSIPGLKEDGSGNAKILKYSANSVEIEANTNGPALLVLTDIFYPGWRVEVNGKPSKIYKTDYTFRGVMVPGGKSNITFTYMPESFLIGIYLFLIGIMGMVVFSVVRKFSKN